jgi:hypothetical protein
VQLPCSIPRTPSIHNMPRCSLSRFSVVRTNCERISFMTHATSLSRYTPSIVRQWLTANVIHQLQTTNYSSCVRNTFYHSVTLKLTGISNLYKGKPFRKKYQSYFISTCIVRNRTYQPWYECTGFEATGVLISPYPDLLPDVFFWMVRIASIVLYIYKTILYIYIYVYTSIVLIFLQLWL